MKKVVFKGVINGETFDNVADYNKKMNSLLSSGETKIQATSSTEVFEEKDKVIENDEPEKVEQFDVDNYIPYFGQESKYHYLDLLVTDSDDLNKKRLKELEKFLKEKYAEVHNLLKDKKLSLDNAIDFSQVVKEIRSSIVNDHEETQEKIEELGKDIAKKQDQLALLEQAEPFIFGVKSYYDAVWDELKLYLLR